MTSIRSALHSMTLSLRRRLRPVEEPPASDPFDHPAIRRMSFRELADLPLPRPTGAQALHELAANLDASPRVP
jgi:hypothetical protein